MFSEQESLVMIMAVVPEEKSNPCSPGCGRSSTDTRASCLSLMWP